MVARLPWESVGFSGRGWYTCDVGGLADGLRLVIWDIPTGTPVWTFDQIGKSIIGEVLARRLVFNKGRIIYYDTITDNLETPMTMPRNST